MAGTTAAGFVLTGPGTHPLRLLRDVWESRRLVAILARKDFLVRYRRTKLGLIWAVALPLTQAVVLSIVFSHVVKGVRIGGAAGSSSYAVFIFAGMVPWTFFNSAFSSSSTAVVDSAGLATKIYFPRMVLPLISIATATYPFIITLLILLGMIVIFGPGIGVATLWMLAGAVLVVALAFALGLFVSAAQVYVRDLRFVVMAGMTVLFYLTPVIYPVSRVPSGLQGLLLSLPAAGPVELFRLAVGAADPLHWRAVGASFGWLVVAGVAGVILHSRRDRVLVDLL